MNGLENCAGGYLSLGFGVGTVVLCGDRLLERGGGIFVDKLKNIFST